METTDSKLERADMIGRLLKTWWVVLVIVVGAIGTATMTYYNIGANGEAIEELQRSHKLWEAKIDSKLKELTDDIQKELKRMAERSDKRHARTMATASELHDFNHELNHHLLSNTKELYQLKGEASK